jgi:hypothetical protein
VTHAIGVCPLRRLEITVRPVRKAQEARCRSTPKMVVLGCEVQRPPGKVQRVGHSGLSQGQPGTVHGDGTREAPKCVFVHDNHLG